MAYFWNSSSVIRYSNLEVGDTLYLQGNATDSWGGPSVNVNVTITAAMVTKGLIVYNWSSGQSYRWWRIYMTSGSSDGYIRIGRVFVGAYSEPDRDYDKDYEIRNVTPSTVIASATGQEYVNTLPQYKQIIHIR